MLEDGKPVCWLPHLHALLFGISKQESLNRLRGVYGKPSDQRGQPIRNIQVTDTPEDFFRVLTYCYKPTFNQKLDHRLSQTRDGPKRSFLSDEQDFELRSYLNQHKVDDRFILINCKKQRTADRAKLNLALNSLYDDIFNGLSSGSTLDEKREKAITAAIDPSISITKGK